MNNYLEEQHCNQSTIRGIFGRRFVPATDDGPMLVDIGTPKSACAPHRAT